MSVIPESQFNGLIGKSLNEAQDSIRTYGNVEFVPNGAAVTMDFNPSRVRVFYDPETNIVEAVENG